MRGCRFSIPARLIDQQAFLLQTIKSLANGRPADLELTRDLRIGDRFTWLQTQVHDLPFDEVVGLVLVSRGRLRHRPSVLHYMSSCQSLLYHFVKQIYLYHCIQYIDFMNTSC